MWTQVAKLNLNMQKQNANEAQKYNKRHIDFEEKQTERQHLLRVI